MVDIELDAASDIDMDSDTQINNYNQPNSLESEKDIVDPKKQMIEQFEKALVEKVQAQMT